MMTRVSFTIKGRPVPWKRMGRNGNNYFPQAGQKQAKDAVRAAYRDAVKGVTYADVGPVAVNMRVHAVFALPQRIPKGDPRHMGAPHAIKPDGDNLGKLIKDALSGVAYDDDAQVSTITIVKQWSDHNCTNISLEYHPVNRGFSCTQSIDSCRDLKRPDEVLETLAKPNHNANKERRL